MSENSAALSASANRAGNFFKWIERAPAVDGAKSRWRRAGRLIGLIAVLALGCTYRMYLARYHTEIGIRGMPRWYDYILVSARSLKKGIPLTDTLYAPGQSVAAYVLFRLFRPDPAVLRVAFGLLDGIAAGFLFLLTREAYGWFSGLFAAGLYGLWPEGASASVNILHDHSPQPLFLFSGLWVLLVWLRRREWWLACLAGTLLGLPAVFRTDGLVVTIAVPAMTLVLLKASGFGWWRNVGAAALIFAGTLVPGIAYDIYHLRVSGNFVHIASGDVGSSLFYRYGRSGGFAGTRVVDFSVGVLGGTSEPFAFPWGDSRRFAILSRFGWRVFRASPVRYARILWSDSGPNFLPSSPYKFWIEPGAVAAADLGIGVGEIGPEWPAAVLVSVSRVQELLTSRKLLLLLSVVGLFAGLVRNPRATLLVAGTMFAWIAALLLLFPESMYFVIPLSLAFFLVGVAIVSSLSVLRAAIVSMTNRLSKSAASA